MLVPTIVRLNQIYRREEDFSADLAQNLSYLDLGRFEEGETEAPVGTRRVDIYSEGDEGILVVECQFGRADWVHWGRLEAYARLKEASIAVLIAEDFEDLMMTTCELRNADSECGWYLIKALGTEREEVIFQIVEGPKIEIQTERAVRGVSEFWEPIRTEGLFAGTPLREDDSWITKSIRGITVVLFAYPNTTKVQIDWPLDRSDERDRYLEKFSDYEASSRETRKSAIIEIPILDIGRNDVDSWDEIRTRLVDVGTAAFQTVNQRLE